MSITQESLAQELNVSTATVSRALRHDTSVHPRTRARVLKLAAESSYTPPEDGRTRGRRASRAAVGQVVVLVPPTATASDSVYWPHAGVLAGMSRAARGLNFQVTVQAIDPGGELGLPDGQDPAGVALLAKPSETHVARIAAERPVCSLVHDYPEITAMDVVGADDFHSIGQLVEHLYAAGHRRVGFLTYHGDQNWERERFGACVSGLMRQGIVFDPQWLVHWEGGGRPSAQDVDALHRAMDAGVTAWMCVNDLLAFTLHDHLQRQGVSVPGDISITGFDGVPPLPGLPRLTTVRAPAEAIGYT